MKTVSRILNFGLVTVFTSIAICCTDTTDLDQSSEFINRSKVESVFKGASSPYIDEKSYAKWETSYESLNDEELAYYHQLGEDTERERLKKAGFGDTDIESYLSASSIAFKHLNEYSHEKYGVTYNKLSGKDFYDASVFAMQKSNVMEKAEPFMAYSLATSNEESGKAMGCIPFVQDKWATVDHRARIGAIAIANNRDNDPGAWFCDYGVTFAGNNYNIVYGITVRAHRIISKNGGMQLDFIGGNTIMLAGRFTVNAEYFGSDPALFGQEVRIGRL
jgi:hypothetical protein